MKNPQKIVNILNYKSILRRKLIKYNKMNNITPMKTHIDVANVRLLTKKKS
jgi:hypothetical protein